MQRDDQARFAAEQKILAWRNARLWALSEHEGPDEGKRRRLAFLGGWRSATPPITTCP